MSNYMSTPMYYQHPRPEPCPFRPSIQRLLDEISGNETCVCIALRVPYPCPRARPHIPYPPPSYAVMPTPSASNWQAVQSAYHQIFGTYTPSTMPKRSHVPRNDTRWNDARWNDTRWNDTHYKKTSETAPGSDTRKWDGQKITTPVTLPGPKSRTGHGHYPSHSHLTKQKQTQTTPLRTALSPTSPSTLNTPPLTRTPHRKPKTKHPRVRKSLAQQALPQTPLRNTVSFNNSANATPTPSPLHTIPRPAWMKRMQLVAGEEDIYDGYDDDEDEENRDATYPKESQSLCAYCFGVYGKQSVVFGGGCEECGRMEVFGDWDVDVE